MIKFLYNNSGINISIIYVMIEIMREKAKSFIEKIINTKLKKFKSLLNIRLLFIYKKNDLIIIF